MWAFIRDITDRKRRRGAPKEKLFTEAILDSLPGTFFLLDSQGKQLRTNRSEIEITGYSWEELSNMHAWSPLPRRIGGSSTRYGRMHGKRRGFLEAQMLTKDGRKISFLFNAKKFIMTICLIF